MSKRVYELTVIFPVETKEEEGKKILKDLVDKAGGEIKSEDFWGERQLAYEIEGNRRGVYVYLEIEMEPEKVKELERRIGLEEKIMRSLLTIKD